MCYQLFDYRGVAPRSGQAGVKGRAPTYTHLSYHKLSCFQNFRWDLDDDEYGGAGLGGQVDFHF